MTLRVLVVDDDERLYALIASYLEQNDVSPAPAENGRRALDLLEREAFDAVLLDVMMPGMDGLTLARRLIAKFGQQTRMVLISGHLSDTSWWPVDLRDVTFVPKPFRLADLERLVAEARAARPQSD